MISLSAAAGALRLLLASGLGAGSRQSIGVVLCGGVVFSTLLSLLVVPLAYETAARWTGAHPSRQRARAGTHRQDAAELPKLRRNT